jgi:hypothetical protein
MPQPVRGRQRYNVQKLTAQPRANVNILRWLSSLIWTEGIKISISTIFEYQVAPYIAPDSMSNPLITSFVTAIMSYILASKWRAIVNKAPKCWSITH